MASAAIAAAPLSAAAADAAPTSATAAAARIVSARGGAWERGRGGKGGDAGLPFS